MRRWHCAARQHLLDGPLPPFLQPIRLLESLVEQLLPPTQQRLQAFMPTSHNWPMYRVKATYQMTEGDE